MVQARICFHKKSPEYLYIIKGIREGFMKEEALIYTMKVTSRISTDAEVQNTGRSLDWIKHSVHEDKWLELRLVT